MNYTFCLHPGPKLLGGLGFFMMMLINVHHHGGKQIDRVESGKQQFQMLMRFYIDLFQT